MATGLSFAVKAVTLLPRTGVTGGTKILSKPLIWRALTKGAADGVAYGDATLTIDQQYEVIVDINQARLRSTAAVGGGIFLATQIWFYNKLQMQNRIIQAGQLIQEAKQASILIEEAVKTKNFQNAYVQGDRLQDIAKDLLILNDGIKALDNELILVADELFDVKNLLGIRQVADEIAATGKSFVAGAKSLAQIDILLPKVQSLFSAVEASAKATGTRTAFQRGVKGVSRIAGKALILDTIIWGITLGIDLGLNLFMSEEEQANLPIIGFLFEGAGWSPIGEALEWVIVNVVEYFVGEETADTLYEAFVAMILAASQAPLISDLFEIVLDFFVDDINGNLLVDLDFNLPDLSFDDLPLNPFKGLLTGDPLVILEIFLYAIIVKIVFKSWVVPMWRFTVGSKGVPA